MSIIKFFFLFFSAKFVLFDIEEESFDDAKIVKICLLKLMCLLLHHIFLFFDSTVVVMSLSRHNLYVRSPFLYGVNRKTCQSLHKSCQLYMRKKKTFSIKALKSFLSFYFSRSTIWSFKTCDVVHKRSRYPLFIETHTKNLNFLPAGNFLCVQIVFSYSLEITTRENERKTISKRLLCAFLYIKLSRILINWVCVEHM